MGGVWEYVGGHMGLYMEVCKNNHGGISVYGGITWGHITGMWKVYDQHANSIETKSLTFMPATC